MLQNVLIFDRTQKCLACFHTNIDIQFQSLTFGSYQRLEYSFLLINILVLFCLILIVPSIISIFLSHNDFIFWGMFSDNDNYSDCLYIWSWHCLVCFYLNSDMLLYILRLIFKCPNVKAVHCIVSNCDFKICICTLILKLCILSYISILTMSAIFRVVFIVMLPLCFSCSQECANVAL